MLVTILALICASGLGCIKPVEETHRQCPCSKDWVCCEGSYVCASEQSLCPAPDPEKDCTPTSCPSGQVCTPVKRCGVAFPGTKLPPKVMLVLDRSGSMKMHSEDDQYGCCVTSTDTTCEGYDPNGSCKWNTLKHLLLDTGGLLDTTKNEARFGLAIFPNEDTSADACSSGQVLVDVGQGSNIDPITQALGSASLVPAGGTPTASTLLDVANDAAFVADEKDTSRYVILITDGMPNCNTLLDPATCQCTSPVCNVTPLNCLDDVRTVDAVKTLFDKGVTTFVIGFGTATNNPAAAQVLNDMATAGGTANSFQADNASDLKAVLDSLVKVQTAPCVFPLAQAPQNPDGLIVILSNTQDSSEVVLSRGSQWDYTDDKHLYVEILGDSCSLIQGATDSRYKLSFLVVTPL